MSVACMVFGHSWLFPKDIWKPVECRRCGEVPTVEDGEIRSRRKG